MMKSADLNVVCQYGPHVAVHFSSTYSHVYYMTKWQNFTIKSHGKFFNSLMNIFEKFTYNMYWSVLNINLIKKKIWQPVDLLGIVFPIFRVTKQTIDDINRLLYSVMYNMEIYCMSLYCIENPYWTRICIVLKTRIGQDARPIRVFNGPYIYPRIPPYYPRIPSEDLWISLKDWETDIIFLLPRNNEKLPKSYYNDNDEN